MEFASTKRPSRKHARLASLAAAVIIALSSFAPSVLAQGATTPPASTPPAAATPPAATTPPASTAPTAAPAASTVTVSTGDTTAQEGCALIHPSTWGTCLARSIASVILSFCAFLLGIAGAILNWVTVKAVFQFSLLIGNSPGLLVAWGILRDIGNMLLLFGFIFIGLSTILDLHTYAAKKTLPRLIIFAILMNFSLFAAEAVIDTSNGLTSVIYNQADSGACFADPNSGTTKEDCAVNYGIAGHIMQSTGISSIYNFDSPDNFLKIDTSVLLGLAMFALISAIVLFAAAILLLTRAVVLTLLMVLAPLGFAGMAIPPLRKAGEQWWNALIHQAFFAPILFLLIFVSLKITDTLGGMDTASNSATRGSLAAALTHQNSGVMGVLMIFMLVIGFMIASLVASKKFGAMGANFAVKTAGGFALGSVGFAGRRTFGRAGGAIGDGIRKTRFGQTEFGRKLAGFGDRTSKASFDLRATAPAGLLGKQIGDLGKAQKGGYDAIVHAGEKARTDYANSLRQTPEDEQKEKELNEKKRMVKNSKEQEGEAWKGTKRTHEEGIKDKRQSNATAERSRQQESADQTAKLAAASAAVLAAPQENTIAAGAVRKQLEEAAQAEQKKLDEMRARHQTDAKREKEDLKGLEDALTADEKTHDANMRNFDREIQQIDRNINGYVDDDGHVQIGVGAQSAKQRYAVNLHNARRSTATAAGRARHHAYEALKKDIKRTKSERILDEIKQSVDKVGGDAHDIAERAQEATRTAETETGGGGHDDHAAGDHH